MFRWFERILTPTAPPPAGEPPAALGAFYWHFIRQSRGLVAALFAVGMLTALVDSAIPVFLGRVVSLVTQHSPAALWAAAKWRLLGMAAVLLVLRPFGLLLLNLVTNQAIAPGMSNLIRWQSHWHVVRQSWTFFQNDFAGRIANRVMQAGPALRESVVSATNAVWYIIVYGGSAMLLMGRADPLLSIPLASWFVVYGILLRVFVPRARERSRRMSEVRSGLTGRVVDSYTNILTVKLFARARDEDAFVAESVDEHTAAFQHQVRLISTFNVSLHLANAVMVVGTGGLAVWLWAQGRVSVGTVAMALPLAWQVSNIAGWVSQNVTAIFENVGIVQDAQRSIAVPRQMPDAPSAQPLVVSAGAISFEGVRFGYGTARGVLHGLDLPVGREKARAPAARRQALRCRQRLREPVVRGAPAQGGAPQRIEAEAQRVRGGVDIGRFGMVGERERHRLALRSEIEFDRRSGFDRDFGQNRRQGFARRRNAEAAGADGLGEDEMQRIGSLRAVEAQQSARVLGVGMVDPSGDAPGRMGGAPGLRGRIRRGRVKRLQADPVGVAREQPLEGRAFQGRERKRAPLIRMGARKIVGEGSIRGRVRRHAAAPIAATASDSAATQRSSTIGEKRLRGTETCSEAIAAPSPSRTAIATEWPAIVNSPSLTA